MIPTAFNEETDYLDSCEDDVVPLSVWRGLNEAGQHVVISCWKPTPEEWEEMRRTGRVWLIVKGTTTFPIAVSGTSPFRQETPNAAD